MHEFSSGVSAYGHEIKTAEPSAGFKYTQLRFGDLYSRYPLQPISGISIIVEGNKFDFDQLDKKKIADIFLQSGNCQGDDKGKYPGWESCMSTFAWGRLINKEVDFLEIQYHPSSNEGQPIIINRNSNVRYPLPLTEKELFSLFGKPIRTEKQIMY